jgi:hypothetical protein
MNWRKYEDVNLTKPVLKVARDFMDMFIMVPMDQRRGLEPVGGAELLKALVDQAEYIWSNEWTARNFAAHLVGVGTLVNAVTYATAAAELAWELRRWWKLDRHEPLTDADNAILALEARLHTLMTDMVCELERDSPISKLRYENGRFVHQTVEHHDDYGDLPVLCHDEVLLKRLTYAHHLTNVGGVLVCLTNPGAGHPENSRWREMYVRVITAFRKKLYETADGRDRYPRWGRDSHVRNGSEYFPFNIAERRALADKLGREVLKI